MRFINRLIVSACFNLRTLVDSFPCQEITGRVGEFAYRPANKNNFKYYGPI